MMAACREGLSRVWDDVKMSEEDVGIDSRSYGGSRPLPLGDLVLASAGQVGINFGHLRAESGCDALVAWSELIDTLRDRILSDDRDYLIGDAFVDLDPSLGDALKAQLGIPEDYFSSAPVEPTRAGLE
jgi:hypothetical protein